MSALTITAGGPLTMSSREIAELVESRHDNVKRTIERLAEKGLIRFTPTEETSHEGAGARSVEVYRVGKRDSYVVVAQLSPEFTARLVDRWQELEEAARRPALPDFTNPVAAARAWADEVEAKQIAVAALEEAKPKLDAYDHFLGSRSEHLNLQRAMKMLGIGPNRGIAALRDSGVLFGSPATPKQYHCDQGYFEVKPVEGTDGKVRPQTLVTPKGLDWLRARLAPMVGH